MNNPFFSPLKTIIFIATGLLLFFAVGLMLLVPSKVGPIENKAPDQTPIERSIGDGCKIGGCNNEICQDESEEDAVSICIYDPKFECYKSVSCEKQANGKCGWTQADELESCLEEFGN